MSENKNAVCDKLKNICSVTEHFNKKLRRTNAVFMRLRKYILNAYTIKMELHKITKYTKNGVSIIYFYLEIK